MNLLKSIAVFAACAVAMGFVATPAAQAQYVEYGAVTIKNPTKNTIYYQFKWGANRAWISYSVPPGYNRTHRYELDNNRQAPKPYIRFDDAQGFEQEYGLSFYATWTQDGANGKPYVFRYTRYGYLELFGQ